jgi:diaminopimelate epimerase
MVLEEEEKSQSEDPETSEMFCQRNNRISFDGILLSSIWITELDCNSTDGYLKISYWQK